MTFSIANRWQPKTRLPLMRGATQFDTNADLWNTFLWPCFQLTGAPEMVAMVSWSHMFWWCRSSNCWNHLQIHVNYSTGILINTLVNIHSSHCGPKKQGTHHPRSSKDILLQRAKPKAFQHIKQPEQAVIMLDSLVSVCTNTF